MNYFLKDVAEYIFRETKGVMKDLIVVFPNRRARLFFNNYLASLSEKPVWAPTYYTIYDFLQEISDVKVADQLTLIFKLYSVFREVTGSRESFDEFYYYCEMILADFDDADKYLVDIDNLYTNLSDLKEMEDMREYLSEYQVKTILQFWETFSTGRQSDEKQSFLNLWEALLEIYKKFNARLDSEGLAYEGKAYRAAIEKLKSGADIPYSDHRVAFVGFNALNRTEEALFDKFKSSGNALFFWDFDKFYLNNEIHEAGFFLRKYVKAYPPPAGFKMDNASIKSPEITTISAPSNVSQAKLINECFSRLGSQPGNAPDKTALILADEGLLLPAVNAIPDSIDKVNISLGYPITDTSIYSFLNLLTDLHANKRVSKTGATLFYHKYFFGLTNHFYFNHLQQSDEWLEFEKKANKENIIYIEPSQFPVESALFHKVFLRDSDARSFGEYLRDIVQCVGEILIEDADRDKALKWQMEALHGVHKVLVRITELLTQIDVELTFKTVLNLIRKILAGYVVPFAGEPLNGLQVMGILETRTLDFENLVILSMNEGKFPKSGNVPSLIPFALREGFGLPTVRHQDAIFAYYFYRLLHRSQKVILVYNNKTEGLQKGEPSRFISQLRYEAGINISQYNAGYNVSALPGKSIRAAKDNQTMLRLQRYLDPQKAHILSPSALNTFINCSLRFYFKYVEGMKELEEVDEEIEANVFGSILHNALENIYKSYEEEEISKDVIRRLLLDKKGISQAIDKAFVKEFFHGSEMPEYHGKALIIRQVIEKYVLGVLEHDLSCAPFTLLGLEGEEKKDITIPGRTEKITVGGIIDRLDEKDGSVRIVDYKTGRVNANFKNVEDLFTAKPSERNSAVFQTFLYSWIYSKNHPQANIKPVLMFLRDIYRSDFNSEIIQSENRRKNSVTDFNEYAFEFEELLHKVLGDLFNPNLEFVQTEDTDYCKNCPYNQICMRKI